MASPWRPVRRSRARMLFPLMEQMEHRQLLSSAVLYGTSGDDHIVVSFDSLTGTATVRGASNVPDGTVLPASTHNDRLSFYIEVGDGNDYVEIGLEPPGEYGFYDASRTTILGGAGDDELIGGNGPVTLDGGAGNDKLVARGSDDPANTVQFSGARKGIRVNLAEGKVYDDGEGGVDVVSGVGSVYGTPFDDTMYSGSVPGELNGFEGNDLLVAPENSPILGMYGFAGDDTLLGGGGGTQFYPGPGNDRVIAASPGGILRYDFPSHAAVVRLDLGLILDDGTGGRDVVRNIDDIEIESDYNDIMFGNDHANTLTGGGGRDLIVGGGGDDLLISKGGILLGGDGNDTLASNGNVRLINGGDGHDLIQLFGETCFSTKIVQDRFDTVEDYRTVASEDKPCEKSARPKTNKPHEARHRSHKLRLAWQGRRWVWS